MHYVSLPAMAVALLEGLVLQLLGSVSCLLWFKIDNFQSLWLSGPLPPEMIPGKFVLYYA